MGWWMVIIAPRANLSLQNFFRVSPFGPKWFKTNLAANKSSKIRQVIRGISKLNNFHGMGFTEAEKAQFIPWTAENYENKAIQKIVIQNTKVQFQLALAMIDGLNKTKLGEIIHIGCKQSPIN